MIRRILAPALTALMTLVLALALALVGCQQQQPQQKTEAAPDAATQLATGSTMAKVLENGVLRVGMDSFVPWAMKDKNGEFIGFEIDVATRLAKDLGVTVEFVPTAWDGIIPALLTGKFDVLIGGMSIRPDRSAKVNFTIPYYDTGMSLVADKAKCEGWDSLADFDKPEVVIVSRTGTTAAASAQKYLPHAEHRFFAGEPQSVQEMLSGRAHALVASAPLPAEIASQHPDKLFVPIKQPFTQEPIGMAVRKGDPDTLNVLDSWIRVVRAEGWIQERQAYWFFGTDWKPQVQ